MVQKSLFRTISRNLVRQLCENGFALADVVDFLNEILDEAISLGGKDRVPGANSLRSEKQKEAARSSACGEARVLGAGEKVDINDSAYIRLLRESDCETLRTWQSAPAVSASLARQKLEQLAASAENWDSERESTELFVICRKADDGIVGMLGYTQIDRRTKQAEFSKMIGEPSERGKGHARNATKVVINYGFDVLGLNRIYLYTLDGNMKNIRLNQSLGFKFEGLLQQAVQIDGRLRDVAIMALLKSQRPSF